MGGGRRWTRRAARGGPVMLLAVILLGCLPAGGARLGFQALKVRWYRVALADALAREDLPGDWLRKIETVIAVRRFAADLGLDAGDHFATFTRLDLDHPGYVLMASPRTGLQPYTWGTPPLDALPYTGFVELRLAHDEATLLGHRGYDTHLRTAGSFRSFGWLATPLVEAHLRLDEVSLARLVLREIQQRSLAPPSARAVAFNESFATFVGYRGAIALFEARAPESALLRLARVGWKVERRYGAYLARLATDLQGAYRAAEDEDAALAAKARLLETAENDLTALSEHCEPLGISRLHAPQDNAAVLYDLYRTSGFDLFEAVHARTRDLRRTIDLIARAAAARPDAPYEAIRDTLTDGGPIPPVLDLLPVAPAIAGPSDVAAAEDAGDRGKPARPPRPRVSPGSVARQPG